MVDGDRLGDVGFQYLGVPYSQMDCQAFVEQCLRDCGLNKNLAGSNAWFREVYNHGEILTPEDCTRKYGKVPKGAFLFILKNDGGEPAKYKSDGMGNASHIGIVTMPRGEGAIHSSSSKGKVCESKFQGKTIPNGGWNRVGLWDQVSYGFPPSSDPDPILVWRPTIRRGSKGEDVKYCQQILQNLGYDLGKSGVDGDFGRMTEQAVLAFQYSHGLDADGVVGPLTWQALEEFGAIPVWQLYTVTIKHVNRAAVDALQAEYSDIEIKEELG